MKDEEDVFEDISEENRSKVWEHFLFNRIDSEAKCVFCSGIIKVPNSSTSALHDHLLKKHSITVSKNPNQTKPKPKSDQKIYDSDETPYEEYSETGDNNDNFEDISDESRQGPFKIWTKYFNQSHFMKLQIREDPRVNFFYREIS